MRAFGLDSVLRFAVLLAVLATAIQSVIVPRGLYADGAYDLWLVLHQRSFVIIGPARSFAIILNQLPVVSALSLGVRNLDALIAFYTFGVAAVPVLIWLVALAIQFRERFFWPLAIIYGVAFLNSGFIAIGEYTYSFALTALSLAVLMSRQAPGAWRNGALVFSSTALILSYEGMAFLAVPLAAIAVVRLWKPAWLALEPTPAGRRWVLWYCMVASVAASAIAASSILLRSSNAADTNLAGALNVGFAFHNNTQWRISAFVGAFLVVTLLVRRPSVVIPLHVVAAGFGANLMLSRNWAPVWLHYNTRSLAALTYFGFVVLALVVVWITRRRGTPSERASRTGWAAAVPSMGVAACIVVFGLTAAFWTRNAGYAVWLSELSEVVRQGSGPIDISTTDLYVGEQSQYSWGWTNPYLSALEQSQYGQGLVLSHVENLTNYTPISPATSPEFFDTYWRNR